MLLSAPEIETQSVPSFCVHWISVLPTPAPERIVGAVVGKVSVAETLYVPAGRETNPARLRAVWRHVVTSTTPPLSHAVAVAASGTKARPFHTLRVGVVSKHHVFPVVGEAILAQLGVALSQVVVAKMVG